MQSAAAGSGVAAAPTVLVSDDKGPAAGVLVTFSVTSGGGAVELASARTDATGKASCGTWTLGSGRGLNTLTATIPDQDPIVFTAMAVASSAGITVTLVGPKSGLVHDVAGVQAKVDSVYQLQSVTASAGTATAALSYRQDNGYPYFTGWAGSLDLSGQQSGPLVVVVTATDVQGHVAEAAAFVTLDRPPTVVLSAPVDQSIARPQITLSATCSDDDPRGCASITISGNGHVLETILGSSVSKSIDLSLWEGHWVQLGVQVADYAGQYTDSNAPLVYVESSPKLDQVAFLGSGRVYDVLGSRILYVDVKGVPALSIYDTSTQAVQTVATGAEYYGAQSDRGFLDASGAIYAHCGADCYVYEVRDGVLSQLSLLNGSRFDGMFLHAAGNYALYMARSNATSFGLTLRDLSSGVSTLVTESIDGDLAPNGTVGWMGDCSGSYCSNVHLWTTGTDRQITNDTAAIRSGPLTNGTVALYNKCILDHRYWSCWVATSDGATETLLSNPYVIDSFNYYGNMPGFVPHTGYEIAGDFIAWTSPDMASQAQVWLRGPAGDKQVSFFSTSSSIDALAPDGTVVFENAAQGRFLVAPGAQPVRIGSTQGRLIYRDGKFYVLLGGGVFSVHTP